MTSLAEAVEIVIGVDTRPRRHHSAAIIHAGTGAVIDEITIPTTEEGYQELLEFVEPRPILRAWAIEGTGSHGAGLTRVLDEEFVIELDRPARATRRNGAKSDPLDAIRAGREALARTINGTPRSAGERQALAVLLAGRRSAVDAYTTAQRQLHGLIIAAPAVLRDKMRGKRTSQMVTTAINWRINPAWDTETITTATVLKTLARRAKTLKAEADTHEKAIKAIIKNWRPELLDVQGVGPIVAAIVLCAWSHPGRVRSEAAFAMLAGAAPIPANSGQVTTRYRLNRYGDRRLNSALHTIVLCRQRHDPDTKTYTERRTTEGKTPREIRRCLKRYIARELYRLLEHTPLDKT